jgi:hypothetical protein
VATSSRSKLVVTTNEKLEPITRGAKLVIVPHTLFLFIELMEVHVVFNIQVEVLEKPVKLTLNSKRFFNGNWIHGLVLTCDFN